MTVFYFIRHGQADFTEANTKIYQGQGYNMLTLSPLGRKQIEAAARDHRLKDAELILSSPLGRTLHSDWTSAWRPASTSGWRTEKLMNFCLRTRPIDAIRS